MAKEGFPVEVTQNQQLARIIVLLEQLVSLTKKQAQATGVIMADLTALTNEVNENNDAVQSAILLLNGLKASLDDAILSEDPAAIQALADQLGAQTDALAAAVVANTIPPVVTTETPTEEPTP